MDRSCPTTTERPACSLCGKIATNETTHRRHVKYCSQAQRRPRKRMRSCLACSFAKKKCSFGQPCTRCVSKDIRCQYQQHDPIAVAQEVATIIRNDLDTSAYGSLTFQSAKLDQNPTLTSPEIAHMATMAFQEITYDELKVFYIALTGSQIMSNTAFVIMGTLSSGLSSATASIIEGFNSNLHIASPLGADSPAAQRTLALYTSGLPPSEIHLLKLRADLHTLARNQIPRHGCKLAKSLRQCLVVRGLDVVRNDAAFHGARTAILDGLQAYPLMMTRRKTFPPFIHHYCDPGNKLPVALAACSDVANMFVSAPRGHRENVWARVRAQHALFRTNIDIASKMDILSYIQADLIYVLMRALDDQSPGLVIDIDNLEMHQILCVKAINMIEFESVLLLMNPRRDIAWDEWVYDETRRRLACLWFIISRVVDLRHGILCPGLQGCREMPLPAPKALWEARSETEWQEECLEAEFNASEMPTTIGDLLDARKADASSSPALLRWVAGCDGLGHLLSLAVSMI